MRASTAAEARPLIVGGGHRVEGGAQHVDQLRLDRLPSAVLGLVGIDVEVVQVVLIDGAGTAVAVEAAGERHRSGAPT